MAQDQYAAGASPQVREFSDREVGLVANYFSAYYNLCAHDQRTDDRAFDGAFSQVEHARLLLERLETLGRDVSP